MRAVIQRVNSSSVEINQKIKSEIQKGLLVLVGISSDDNKSDVEWLVNKILNLRIFNDDEGKMKDAKKKTDSWDLLRFGMSYQKEIEKV